MSGAGLNSAKEPKGKRLDIRWLAANAQRESITANS